MPRIEIMRDKALPQGPSSPGIQRRVAFKGAGYLMLVATSEPGMVSGWHHHLEYDVYGYVASGIARFESDLGTEDAVVLGTGDWFHVSPHTVHRESNPSMEETNRIILFLRGMGPMVANVD